MRANREISKQQLLQLYQQMILIRRFEEKSAELYTLGKIRGFLHLYIGEEAIAVGAMAVMQPEDYIVTHYRDHGHALARGLSPNSIMAELFGKDTGCSRGKGGSMHLFDVSRNFMGGYAIVGGQFPLAVGLALASKMCGENRIVIVFFGDGAINEGEFHEAMNLASLWKLPLLFFLENNFYGMGSHVDRTYSGGKDIIKAGDHYGIPAEKIDGMDVLAVMGKVEEVAQRVRRGEGPFFLEAATYRFRGHSMADPAQYRDRAEETYWRTKDPITQMHSYLLDAKLVTPGELEKQEKAVKEIVNEAVQFAEDSADPPPEALYENI